MKKYLLTVSLILALASCKQESKTVIDKKKPVAVRIKPKSFGFHFEKTKDFLASTSDSSKIWIVLAVNRTDKTNIRKMDSIIVPKDLTGDLAFYLPFPFRIKPLSEVSKIVLFSYPTQSFAAYEYGDLIRTGPTNMGRKKDQTPIGLFFTNWKAEKTTSTFNDEWDLKWNFNIANKLGVGWHQYELPGYPASHSCLRLQERDAKYLYKWADEWVLQDKQTVKLNGTPVIVFGHYDFDAPKPWYQLVKDPNALNISAESIENEIKPYLSKILSEQQKRENTSQ